MGEIGASGRGQIGPRLHLLLLLLSGLAVIPARALASLAVGRLLLLLVVALARARLGFVLLLLVGLVCALEARPLDLPRREGCAVSRLTKIPLQ